MRLVGGRAPARPKQRGVGATIEVVGPASPLAKKVARVLEQHGHNGALLRGSPKRKRVSAGGSGRAMGLDLDLQGSVISIDVERAYVVNALKPDGSTAPTEVREQVQSVREREDRKSVV